ncbi:MAG: PilZ domain-containing protein [Leptospiraceae bacterium]|nr:PilZ domain-containing protein [Leptospiraceae bacterium]
MIFWNQKRVDALMHGIASGFPEAGPLDYAILIGLIVGLVLLVLWLERRLDRRRKDQAESASLAQWHRYILQFQLNPVQVAALSDLADALTNPLLDRHRLFQESDLFEQTLQTWQNKTQPGTAADQKELRIRLKELWQIQTLLEFRDKKAGRELKNTLEIPVGSRILQPDGRLLGTVHENQVDYLLLRNPPRRAARASAITDSASPVAAPMAAAGSGTPDPGALTCVLRRPEGLYQFTSQTLAHPDLPAGYRILQHAERLERIQRRNFPRCPVQISGYLDGVTVQLKDLSAGGAQLQCSAVTSRWQSALQQKQSLRLTFPIAQFKIESTVLLVRISQSTLSVTFEKIREGDRDRIVRYLRSL